MTDPLKQFERLVETARCESSPDVDVTASVMDRLSVSASDGPAQKLGNRVRRNVVRWSVVASIFAAAVWIGWFARTESNQALAAIQQARHTLAMPSDRTYTITVEGQSPRGLTHERQATLFARGTDHFVFKIAGPFGTDILAGSDGNESWLIPPVGPVLIGSDSLLIDRWLSQERVPIPLLSLDETLHRLESRYNLSVVSDEIGSTADIGHRSTMTDSIRVIGRRRPEEAMIPDTVELWSNRTSGILQRLELRWSDAEPRPGPQSITVVLKSEEQLAADFFIHTRHHPPEKPVRVIHAE